MNRLQLNAIRSGVAALAYLITSSVLAAPITYQMVAVGNAGNLNDTGGSHVGRVDYSYAIGKYEVTIGQYTAFLNTVDAAGTNPHSIYNPAMGSNLNTAGIAFDGSAAAGSKYRVINNDGDSSLRPITNVTWWNAARFANWMSNGQGTGSTETGAYTLNGSTGGTVSGRNPGAFFYLPNQSEWYKAAYYSPVYGGQNTPGYYLYATQSNAAPGNIAGTAANQANYYTGSGYSVTQNASQVSSQNYLTNVGAFAGSASFYGTYDQNGNVFEMIDRDGTNSNSVNGFVEVRGGFWSDTRGDFFLKSGNSGVWIPQLADYNVGFRLAGPAAVVVTPEIDPANCSSVLPLVAGVLAMVERRRQRALLVS